MGGEILLIALLAIWLINRPGPVCLRMVDKILIVVIVVLGVVTIAVGIYILVAQCSDCGYAVECLCKGFKHTAHCPAAKEVS